MLQASRDLIEAAQTGHVQDVKALLLNGADPEATAADSSVSYSICTCIFGTAYIACENLILILRCCSKCHIHVSCLM